MPQLGKQRMQSVHFSYGWRCQVPIAGYATVDGDSITLTGMVAAPDASVFIKKH